MAVLIVREEEIEKWFRFITKQFAVIRRELREIKQTMVTQEEFDVTLGSLGTAVQTLGTDMQKAFDDLTAKINAGAKPADLTAERDQVQAIIDRVTGFDATAVSQQTPPAV